MPTQKDVLTFLTNIKPQLQKDGIEQVGLFGSYGKNSATLASDIDIAIKLNKNYLDKNKVELADAFIANNKLTYEKLSNRLTEMLKKENLVEMIKENHAFIIILPPKSRGPYFSNNGIFTEGINSVIQSVARQRKVGEIHIVLPHPILMDYSSLIEMSPNQRNNFIQAYNEIGIDPSRTRNRNGVTTPLVRYIPFSEHFEIIKNK